VGRHLEVVVARSRSPEASTESDNIPGASDPRSGRALAFQRVGVVRWVNDVTIDPGLSTRSGVAVAVEGDAGRWRCRRRREEL
jgi:hypothetical protein